MLHLINCLAPVLQPTPRKLASVLGVVREFMSSDGKLHRVPQCIIQESLLSMSCRSVWLHTCRILWCYVFLKSGLHLDVSFTRRNHITSVPVRPYESGLQLYMNYKHIQNFITH